MTVLHGITTPALKETWRQAVGILLKHFVRYAGLLAWDANSSGLSASAAAVTIPHDIFADLPEETPASASRQAIPGHVSIRSILRVCTQRALSGQGMNRQYGHR